MELNGNGMSPADFAALSGNGINGSGSWFWLIILFLFMFNGNGMMGGWGGNGFGWGVGNQVAPWMMFNDTNANVRNGFDQATAQGNFNALQNSITNGFANAEVADCNRYSNTLQTLGNNQSQVMQQFGQNRYDALKNSYDSTLATLNGFNGIQNTLTGMQGNFNTCCCDMRAQDNANYADLKYTVSTENAADRSELAQGVSNILAATQSQTQAILDKLCQQEVDALKSQNSALQNQILMKDLSASQAAQTAQLVADNAAQTQYVVNRVAPYPVPAYPVASPYGYAYGWNNGCGCGAA